MIKENEKQILSYPHILQYVGFHVLIMQWFVELDLMTDFISS